MNNLEKNLKKEPMEELYNTYTKIISLIDNLEKSIKELPAKEEL